MQMQSSLNHTETWQQTAEGVSRSVEKAFSESEIPQQASLSSSMRNRSTITAGRRSSLSHHHRLRPTYSEIVHPHFAVLTSRTHPPITKAYASDRSCMARECALTFSGACVPHLDHSILRPAHHSEGVCRESPHPFHVSEVST